MEDAYLEQAMLLDVLEHIENDKEFLILIKKKLKINGRLLITVPAFEKLWSSEDDAAGHFRRYTIERPKLHGGTSGLPNYNQHLFFWLSVYAN